MRLAGLLLFAYLVGSINFAIIVLGLWFVIQLLSGLGSMEAGSSIAWFAHVGGFAFGWLYFRLRLAFRRQPTVL